MTTARIASSSIHRPALLPSAAEVLELIIRPGDARAQRAEHVHHDLDAARPDADQPAGLGVAADRLDQQAERGAAGERHGDGHDRGHDEDARTAASASSRRRSACTASLLTVMIWPSVISWATPRPATIRISVAMIGWMPIRATRKPFHRPQTSAAASAEAHRQQHSGQRVLVGLLADVPAGQGAGDGDHRADRQVDAAGGDDQGHAERHQDQRRAEQHDRDQAAVEVAVLHLDREEVRA